MQFRIYGHGRFFSRDDARLLQITNGTYRYCGASRSREEGTAPVYDDDVIEVRYGAADPWERVTLKGTEISITRS